MFKISQEKKKITNKDSIKETNNKNNLLCFNEKLIL